VLSLEVPLVPVLRIGVISLVEQLELLVDLLEFLKVVDVVLVPLDVQSQVLPRQFLDLVEVDVVLEIVSSREAVLQFVLFESADQLFELALPLETLQLLRLHVLRVHVFVALDLALAQLGKRLLVQQLLPFL